jgi:hypothetical protein
VAAVHSEIKSSNIKEITPLPGWGGIFTKAKYDDGTLFVAITDQIQVGVAFQRTHQWFGEGVTGTNYRSELGLNMFF